VLLLHQAGATYGFDLIYGLPGDTLAGFYASLDFALSLMPNHLDIFPLSVLPGTRLQDTAPDFGLQHLQDIPYTVLASLTFSAADMGAAARTARACDLFYNQGKAVPWFALIQEALDLAPSALFQRFADFLEAQAEADVTALQVAFLAGCFPDAKTGAVAADVVTYFGRSGALLEAAAQAPEGTHVCEASFHHDPQALLDHLESGLTDLAALAEALPEHPYRAMLQVEGDEVSLRILG
jgi:hypothetical protein